MSAGNPKFNNHIRSVIVTIINSFMPIKLNTQIATEPLISQSNSANPGIIEAKRYMEVMSAIRVI
jgi:hypothetical protein